MVVILAAAVHGGGIQRWRFRSISLIAMKI
jgi:hypothetical protein